MNHSDRLVYPLYLPLFRVPTQAGVQVMLREGHLLLCEQPKCPEHGAVHPLRAGQERVGEAQFHHLWDEETDFAHEIETCLTPLAEKAKAIDTVRQAARFLLDPSQPFYNLGALALLDYLVMKKKEIGWFSSQADVAFKERYLNASCHARVAIFERLLGEMLNSRGDAVSLRRAWVQVKHQEPIESWPEIEALDRFVLEAPMPLALKAYYCQASTTAKALTVDMWVLHVSTRAYPRPEDRHKLTAEWYLLRKSKPGFFSNFWKSEEEVRETRLRLERLIYHADIPEEVKRIVRLVMASGEEGDVEVQGGEPDALLRLASAQVRALQENSTPDKYERGIASSAMEAALALSDDLNSDASLAWMGCHSVLLGGKGLLGGSATMPQGESLLAAVVVWSVSRSLQEDGRTLPDRSEQTSLVLRDLSRGGVSVTQDPRRELWSLALSNSLENKGLGKVGAEETNSGSAMASSVLVVLGARAASAGLIGVTGGAGLLVGGLALLLFGAGEPDDTKVLDKLMTEVEMSEEELLELCLMPLPTKPKTVQVWRLIAHHKHPRQVARIYEQEDFVALGWGHIGDLRKGFFRGPRGITQAIKRVSGKSKNHGQGGRVLWGFLHEMQIGDWVIVKDDEKRTCVMEITGNYEWTPEEDEVLLNYQHRRRAIKVDVDPDKLWKATRGHMLGWSDRWSLTRCQNTVRKRAEPSSLRECKAREHATLTVEAPVPVRDFKACPETMLIPHAPLPNAGNENETKLLPLGESAAPKIEHGADLFATGLAPVTPSPSRQMKPGSNPNETPTAEPTVHIAQSSSPALTPGLPLLQERYQLERLLGEGGMGKVYLAHDQLIDERCALKLIRDDLAENAEIRKRFVQELRLTRRLAHPNIVRTHDLKHDKAADALFFTMEYVEGRSLEALLAAPLEAAPVLGLAEMKKLLLALAQALDYAHREGVIHRDLKPGNVMILPDRRVKLMDFGIAKVFAGSNITQHTSVIGTAFYMSPEQAKGVRELTPAADVFSLGVMTYEMLTGELPRGMAEPPSMIVEGLSEAWDRLVQKAMALRPERRYQSALAFADALQQIPDTSIVVGV